MDEVQIASVLSEINGDIGAFHTHRDAEFNLLFHASIEGSLPAVKVRVVLGHLPKMSELNPNLFFFSEESILYGHKRQKSVDS